MKRINGGKHLNEKITIHYVKEMVKHTKLKESEWHRSRNENIYLLNNSKNDHYLVIILHLSFFTALYHCLFFFIIISFILWKVEQVLIILQEKLVKLWVRIFQP